MRGENTREEAGGGMEGWRPGELLGGRTGQTRRHLTNHPSFQSSISSPVLLSPHAPPPLPGHGPGVFQARGYPRAGLSGVRRSHRVLEGRRAVDMHEVRTGGGQPEARHDLPRVVREGVGVRGAGSAPEEGPCRFSRRSELSGVSGRLPSGREEAGYTDSRVRPGPTRGPHQPSIIPSFQSPSRRRHDRDFRSDRRHER